MAAAATMEHNGVPIDVPLLIKLRERWSEIQDQLIADIDFKDGVYDGRTFKADCSLHGWPRRGSHGPGSTPAGWI